MGRKGTYVDTDELNRQLGEEIVNNELTDDQILRLALKETTPEEIMREQGELWTIGLCQYIQHYAEVKAHGEPEI